MILYADTSALVKKYVDEPGTRQVVKFFEQQELIGTSTITQVEMAAAMSKAVRLGWIDKSSARLAWIDFNDHWLAYTRLPASAGLVDRASSLAWRRGLRAYDAVHLASALNWQDITGEDVIFACYDKQLLKAAQQEGLYTWPEGDGETK